ncbi:hypothetical protein MRB53_021575 [Persea americana]|uniref:Uncharacterized protein n=1 Tax=Persea americana TaxID=3435 RepID=A0ACC2L4R6_PERAE|nr:hypothetical protein MRB53_021575 [Persea americana]
MRILGSKISVPLGAQLGAFEGAYASTFEIELGSHNRRLVPLYKETWAAIDDGCKEAILLQLRKSMTLAIGRPMQVWQLQSGN